MNNKEYRSKSQINLKAQEKPQLHENQGSNSIVKQPTSAIMKKPNSKRWKLLPERSIRSR